MGLGNYAAASNGLGRELGGLLEPAALDAIGRDLEAIGKDEWLGWLLANWDDVADFASATPARRSTLKKWANHPQKPRLILAAMLHCQRAEQLLGFLAQHEVELSPGGSYRDTTALAGTLFREITRMPIPLWPRILMSHCPPSWRAHPDILR